MARKTNYKNLKPQVIDMIRAYLALIEKEGYSIKKAIVFGSYAKNKANNQSDLDLCLVSPSFGKDGIGDLFEVKQHGIEIPWS